MKIFGEQDKAAGIFAVQRRGTCIFACQFKPAGKDIWVAG